MKKNLFIILIIFCVFFIGCKNDKPIEVSKTIIDIECTNEVYEYDIDEFDINDITFTIIYSDETKEIKSLETSMISEEDLSKLSDHGTHEIIVSYNEISKKITINLIKKYKVIFKLDGEILHEEKVEFGKSANPPKIDEAPGFHFTGWDKEFNNITSDLVVNALYTVDEFPVTFTDVDGEVIKTEIVKYGGEAVAPDIMDVGYYKFIGWDKEFNNITEDTTIKSVYKKNTLEFDEDLKAKCIEDFKGLQGIIITDNPELLCVYGDIYVVCFERTERSAGYIYNGYQIFAVPDESYECDKRTYFVHYKQYERYIWAWSPVEGAISVPCQTNKEITSLDGLLLDNVLTIEQVKGIPWPQLEEMPEDPNNIGIISEETIKEFGVALENYGIKWSEEYYTYYGTYEGVIIIGVDFSGGFGFKPTISDIIESREIIYVNSRERLFTYKDGVVYNLKEAYDNGIISYEAICKIPYLYKIISE